MISGKTVDRDVDLIVLAPSFIRNIPRLHGRFSLFSALHASSVVSMAASRLVSSYMFLINSLTGLARRFGRFGEVVSTFILEFQVVFSPIRSIYYSFVSSECSDQ